MPKPSSGIPNWLLVLLVVYCGASLLHFVHNAEFLADYPNLPAWLTRSKVYLAWLAITAVGVAGTLLIVRGLRRSGLLLIAIYALLGFAGLDHYWAAPLAAHSLTMNLTIWFEVAAASALLIGAGVLLFTTLRPAHRASSADSG